MGWLHHLTGFQLWVIAAFYDISYWQAEARYERSKRSLSISTMISAFVAGVFFTIYWIIVAAWPAITH